jgi:hypothetical protein
MTDLERWLARRAEEDARLYERYGKSLEKAHKGEFVAISADGQTILGSDDNEVFRSAIEAFGSGNFGLFRIGYPALEKWLSLTR